MVQIGTSTFHCNITKSMNLKLFSEFWIYKIFYRIRIEEKLRAKNFICHIVVLLDDTVFNYLYYKRKVKTSDYKFSERD